jgi:nucleoside-diphosphate-sugar epimerase
MKDIISKLDIDKMGKRLNVGVFGGTHYVGRHIVRSLLDYKHKVTLMNRCKSNMHLYPHMGRFCIDRDKPIELGNIYYDCIIDLTSSPLHIINSLMSDIKYEHYIYISSCSVYEYPRLSEISQQHYADYVEKKHLCEGMIQKLIPANNYLIIRPGYVCGEYDNTNRFDYSRWPDVYWAGTDNKLEKYDDVYEFSDWISTDLVPNKVTGIIDTELSKEIKESLKQKNEE